MPEALHVYVAHLHGQVTTPWRAGVAQLVEYELPKLGVASSNLVARSITLLACLLGLPLEATAGAQAPTAVDLPEAVTEPAPSAQPQPATWWIGLPIAQVQLVAGAGTLPDESLAPLLTSRQGEPANPQHLRDDLETLYQAGEFSAIEAEIEEGFVYGPSGEPTAGVALTYRVYPAPRVARVRVSGRNPHFSDREILGATGIGPGANFYPEVGIEVTHTRLQGLLTRAGYPDGEVVVSVAERRRGLRVDLSVDEGTPSVLEDVAFIGDVEILFPNGSARPLERWAGRGGLRPGKPYTAESVTRAQLEIRAGLADLHRAILRERRGWIAARVTPAIVTTPTGRRVSFSIEPGAQLDLDVAGIESSRADRRARAALGIDERLRLTRGFLEDAPDRLEASLQADGFLDASATVVLEEVNPHLDVLHIDVEQGPRYRLKRGRWPNRVGATFTGNENASTADLQAVLEQASETVLRRGFYTPEAMKEGLASAEDYYAARGYQQAETTPGEIEIRPRRGWLWRATWAPVRWVTGRLPVREVRIEVAVAEGPLTLQENVSIVGAAPEVDGAELAALSAELDPLAGQPFSPLAVDLLARRLLEVHRESGFLEADLRVIHTPTPTGTIASTLEITPGAQVLLRSVVTRGLRQIKPDFVRREVDLRLGEPLAFSEQQRVRDDLYSLGAFRAVELTLLGDEAARDLVIGVTERAPWSFEAGGGVSTDQGTRLFGRITRRNLFYLPHRLDFQLQIGLDWLSDSVVDWRPDFRSPDFRAVTTYRAPRFPGRHQDLTLDILFRERLAERTWRMARTGGGIGIAQHVPLGRTSLDVRGGLRLETRQLQEVDRGALLPGEPWEEILAADPTIPTAWRVQDSVTALAVFDARDSQLAPTRGFVVQATGEYAPGQLADALTELPDVSFAKAGGRLTTYLPLFGLTLRVAGSAERAFGLDGGVVPLEDRFRLGGTASMRGFARDSVGPRALASRLEVDFPDQIDPIVDYALRNNATRWVPTGGDLSAQGSVELQLPWPALGLTAWDGWAGALFADLGNVWLQSDDTTVTSNLPLYAGLLPAVRAGVGAGIRVATPVGPLQFDLATNVQALTAQGATRILLVEEWEEPKFRAHLSLGALW